MAIAMAVVPAAVLFSRGVAQLPAESRWCSFCGATLTCQCTDAEASRRP
jgi:hypothetical protein